MSDPASDPAPPSAAASPAATPADEPSLHAPPPKDVETPEIAPDVAHAEGITEPAEHGSDVPAPEPVALMMAPEIPRIERPMGTSRAIPETMLGHRPSPSFLAVVSIASLASDIVTKLWAEKRLEGYPGYVNIIDNHLMFVLAKNKGGAWGLLQGQSENVRRPFFLLVSVAAIAFIVTLYRRLQPRQHALKWGLPLVLGGALGNVFDRIRYGFVIDFIDYRADWIHRANELVQKRYPAHIVTDHWPTFNVADVAICVGVALMAVDMLTSRRGKKLAPSPDVPVEPVDVIVTPLEASSIAPSPEALVESHETAAIAEETKRI